MPAQQWREGGDQSRRLAGGPRAAAGLVGRALAPDRLNLTVIQTHFQTERLPWVGFDLAQELNKLIEVGSHGYNLSAPGT
jgi:hypothetical protein